MSELTFKVYPYRPKVGMGNVVWANRDRGSAYYRTSRFAMNHGKFPKDHPVGGGSNDLDQMGGGPTIEAFRARGYWASCFPEGDGMCWKPLNGQNDAQCLTDIRECFGWDARWAENVPAEVHREGGV